MQTDYDRMVKAMQSGIQVIQPQQDASGYRSWAPPQMPDSGGNTNQQAPNINSDALSNMLGLGGMDFTGSASSGLGGGIGGAAGGAAGGAMSGMFGGGGSSGLMSGAGSGFASGFTGSAGGAAGGTAGSSAGGAGVGALGWIAALAAVIAANESAAEEDGARNPNKTQWYGDVLTGRVFEQDMSKRWLPKMFGESQGGGKYKNDKYGFGADAHALADISTGDWSNAFDTLRKESTLAKALKKVF